MRSTTAPTVLSSDLEADFLHGSPSPTSQITFFGDKFAHRPDDANVSLDWVSNELPTILQGWETNNGGSERYKGQKIRALDGGLQGRSIFSPSASELE